MKSYNILELSSQETNCVKCALNYFRDDIFEYGLADYVPAKIKHFTSSATAKINGLNLNVEDVQDSPLNVNEHIAVYWALRHTQKSLRDYISDGENPDDYLSPVLQDTPFIDSLSEKIRSYLLNEGIIV